MDTVVCPICGCNRWKALCSAPDRFFHRNKLYQLVRCLSCTLVRLDNPPPPEEMAHHYGTEYHAEVVAAGETGIEKRWRYSRKRVLEMVQGGTLLDIGCNSGGFLRSLSGGDWDLYGVEISLPQARRAEATSGAQVFVGDILDAPFPDSSFDVITGFHVLEHVYQPVAVIKKLWEWLKPGGLLYLHVPNIQASDAYIFKSYWYGLELPRHLFHFSPSSLSRLLSAFDFDEIRLRTLPYTHIEASIPYVLHELRGKLGMAPISSDDLRDVSGITWRVFRKVLRLCFLNPFGYASALVGRGSGIEAMFRKRILPDCSHGLTQAQTIDAMTSRERDTEELVKCSPGVTHWLPLWGTRYVIVT
jgi:SAM-dependent methyltransferase